MLNILLGFLGTGLVIIIYGSNKKLSINWNTNNSIVEATVTGLAKSVAQCPRVTEFSSQAAKMKHRPAQRDI